MLRPERVRVWKNPVTGTWRVDIGERSGYYCRTWDDAMDRADEIARDQRAQRAAALYGERFGDGSRL